MSRLVKELNFYTQYHKNITNKVLHIIGIPVIVWSMMVCLWNTYLLLPLTAFYMIYYIKLDKQLGLITDAYFVILLLFARYYYTTTEYACIKAFGFQLGAWVLQFIGHYYFERNRPALMDSIYQAFLMAPIFITAEVAFMFGYKPVLQRRIQFYTHRSNFKLYKAKY